MQQTLATPRAVPPTPAPVYAIRCVVCTRMFPPNEYAREQWNHDVDSAVPMACPHCRATGVYRFEHLSLRTRLWP
jgi:MoaA/NifB/PqqE/SkfB family radical SAM enzyme